MASSSMSQSVCLLLLSLTLCQSVVHGVATDSEVTPVEHIQAEFKEVTGLSSDLTVEASKITFLNAATQGVKVGAGFSVIVVKVAEYTARLERTADGYTTKPLNDDDANLVVASLTTFVKVHQVLLNVVIGKHGVATLLPFFEPIRVSLVNLEEVIDTFASYLIDLIPTQKAAAEDQFGSLSVTVKKAEKTCSKSLHLRRRTDKPLVEVIKDAINELTELSDKKRIEIEKAPHVVPILGRRILKSFGIIIEKVTEATTALAHGTNPSTLDDDDAKEVVEVLTEFVKKQQKLLNVVIEEQENLTGTEFIAYIRQALKRLKAEVKSFGKTLIDLIPTQKPAATVLVDSLDGTINQAMATYTDLFPKKHPRGVPGSLKQTTN